MQLVDREQERVDRHVVDALKLLLERAQNGQSASEKIATLRSPLPLTRLNDEIERQAVERDAIELRAGALR